MQNNLVPYLHEINLSDPEEIARDYDHQLIQFVIDVSDAMCHLQRHKVSTEELQWLEHLRDHGSMFRDTGSSSK